MKIKITKKQLLKENTDLFDARSRKTRIKRILLEEIHLATKKYAEKKIKTPLDSLEEATKRLKKR